MQWLHEAILRGLPWVPRTLVRRIAGRYIAGESLADSLGVVTALERQGLLTTVDVLGENVRSREEARRATEEYLELVERLSQQGLPSQVSLKPTLLGLRVSEGVAAEHIEEVVVCAGRRRISVCIDMEDSSTTDATLNIFRRLREAHAHVGVAIQAYLRRSEADLVSLLPLRPSVRVCKGIYREPLGLVIEGRQAVRESYLRLVKLLLDGGGFPALATHDPWLVDQSLRLLEARRQDPGSYELQMLLGVGEALRPKILATGAQLRIYCPYGPDWYAYSLRRLQENPHMVGYVLKAAFSPRILRRGHLSGPGSSGAADPAGA